MPSDLLIAHRKAADQRFPRKNQRENEKGGNAMAELSINNDNPFLCHKHFFFDHHKRNVYDQKRNVYKQGKCLSEFSYVNCFEFIESY